jgi:hypothetical protein
MTPLDRLVAPVSETDSAASAGLRSQAEKIERISLREAIREYPALVLLAEPGMGKTTCLLYAKYGDASTSDSIEKIKVRNLLIELGANNTLEDLVVADAIDELNDQQRESFRVQLRTHLPKQILLSCRASAWTESIAKSFKHVIPNLQTFVLIGLDQNQKILILRQNLCTEPEELLRRAVARGLGYLTENPQTLLFLKNIRQSEWTDSRANLFSSAVNETLSEKSPHHRDQPCLPKTLPPQKLSAARYLCLMGLLSQRALIARQMPAGEKDTPAQQNAINLEEILETADKLGVTINHFDAALGASLFKRNNEVSIDKTLIWNQPHRNIAEYLAANALLKPLGKGLSQRRLMNFLTQHDGKIPSYLHGLSGWLATLEIETRSTLILSEPLVVLRNADLSAFDTQSLTQLLRVVKSHLTIEMIYNENFSLCQRSLQATFDKRMIPFWTTALKELRVDNDIEKIFLYLVLQLHKAGNNSKSAAPLVDRDLLQLFWNHAQAPNASERSRQLTLILAIKQGTIQEHDLLRFLNRIVKFEIPDPRNALRGALLYQLFPKTVTPEQLFNYAYIEQSSFINDYTFFWHDLPKKARKKKLIDLASAAAHWLSTIGKEDIGEVDQALSASSRIIAKALEQESKNVSIDQVSQWLAATLDIAATANYLGEDESFNLSQWITQHHEIALQMTELWLQSAPLPRFRLIEISVPLRHIESSGAFWLKQWEKNWIATNKDGGEFCVAQLALWGLQHPTAMAKLEHELKRIQKRHPLFKKSLANSMAFFGRPPKTKLDTKTAKMQESQELRRNSQLAKQTEWISSNLDSLAAGKPETHSLLHAIALARLGSSYGYKTIGDNQIELIRWVETNAKAKAEVNAGMINLAKASAVFSLEDICKAYSDNSPYFVQLPSLVGANLLLETDRSGFAALPSQTLESLVAHHITSNSKETNFLAEMAASKRELLLEAITTCVVKIVKVGKAGPPDFFVRLCPPNSQKPIGGFDFFLSILACVIRKLPNRIASGQQQNLRRIILLGIHAATTCNATRELEVALEKKLSIKSIDSFLRTELTMLRLSFGQLDSDLLTKHFALGLRLKPSLVTEFFIHVLGFFESGPQTFDRLVTRLLLCSSTQEIVDLLAYIGLMYPPTFEQGRYPMPGDKYHRNGLMERVLHTLATHDEMGQIFDTTLIAQLKVKLPSWEKELENLRRTIALKSTDHSADTLDPKTILEVLVNGKPFDQRSLQSLCMDTLDEYQRHLTASKFNLREQFWRDKTTTGTKPVQHKDEPECRNVIGAYLEKTLLPLGIAVNGEAQAPESTRTDIRVDLGSSCSLPIEVKGEWHDEVWQGAKNQLVGYAGEPSASNFGIYLVIWTGGKELKSARTRKIYGPQDLKTALDNGIKTKPWGEKFEVFVLDVSWPN